MKRCLPWILVMFVMQSLAGLVSAQSLTTGAVTGTVMDQSGAVMPNVLVVATNVESGATRKTLTNATGAYLLAQLDPGTYQMSAESSGFAKTQIGPINVGVSRIATVDVRLKLGEATQVVKVEQPAPLIEPSNPNTTTTFSATQIANLPNPGNDLTYLANLAPGAIINPTTANYPFNGGNVEFNGLPSLSNDFTIDGLDSNNTYGGANATGASGLQLGLNAIQEVTINTVTLSAEQGKLSASQINYVTKSGTNEFHGNAYEVWNGSAMNSSNFFLNANGQAKPRSNTNEFGASLGGPILKNKLFFFTDFEGIRLVLPAVLTNTLPAPAYQAYVLQQLPQGGPDTVLGGSLPPQPGEVQFYKNMFSLLGDTSRGNPLAILGCPLNADGSMASGSPPDGNGCANSRTFSASPSVNETLFTAKLDYTLDAKNSFWFRFQLNQGENVRVDSVNSIFNSVLKVPSRSAGAGWTHVFNSNLVNQFNPGVSYQPAVRNLGDPARAIATFPISYSVDDFGTTIGNNVDSLPSGQNTTTWQLNDNLSWIRGRHTFRFGADFRRYLFSVTNASTIYPFEEACSLPEFTYGATCNTTQAFPSNGVEDRIKAVSLDTYASDTFRLTPKVLLITGLRTVWNSVPISTHKAFSALDGGSFEAIPHDVNAPLNSVILSSVSKAYTDTPLLQWNPRVAVAYQVKSKTVLRAGFGIFAQPAPFGLAVSALNQNPPLYNSFNAGLQNPIGGIAIAPGVPGSAVDAAVAANQQYVTGFAKGELSCASSLSDPAACLQPIIFTNPAQNTKYPAIYEWMASAQQDIGQTLGLTVRYLGTRLRQGQYTTLDNGFQTACPGCFAKLPYNAAPDARFSLVQINRSGANSSYDGLQLSVEQRTRHGLSFQANYTYSHCLDYVSNGAQSFNKNFLQLPTLPGGLRNQYGDCDYDVRHSLNAYYVYQLPLRSSRAWLNFMIAGWQVSGTVFARGGFPTSVLSLITNGSLQNLTYPVVYANVVAGKPLYEKNPIQGVTAPGTIQWLNPNAFQSVFDRTTGSCFPTTSVQNCQNGDAGRNTVRTPGFTWTDLDISKRFKISERLVFKFDAQFYNLLNHPNFGFPSFGNLFAGIPSKAGTLTNFGTISNTVSPSTGLVGGRLGGDSSVRMIAIRGTLVF